MAGTHALGLQAAHEGAPLAVRGAGAHGLGERGESSRRDQGREHDAAEPCARRLREQHGDGRHQEQEVARVARNVGQGQPQRIRALPGVEAAGTINDLPFADGSSQTLHLEGYPVQRNPVALQVRQITPGYLRAMGIPVLRGRDVIDSDAEVLLVSQEAAKLYWGVDDPIGRRATLPFSATVLRQVVGIVGDVKQRNLIEPVHPRCTTTRARLPAG